MQPKIENELALLREKTSAVKLAATLEIKLDLAYEIYVIGSELLNSLSNDNTNKRYVMHLRDRAVEFMKILLNVSSNKEMITLAENRKKMRVFDPFYLPRCTEIAGIDNAKTRSQYNWKRLARLALLLKNQKIMRVNDWSRQQDQDIGIIYLTAEQRAIHRIVLKEGRFYRPLCGHGFDNKEQFTLCDTNNMISHGKKGYASYVISVHGEISIFNHNNEKDHYAHSSIYAGASVFSAGEIRIVKGELVAITAYSGHYQPSADNMYSILKYFQKHGCCVYLVDARLFELDSNICIPGILKAHGTDPKYHFFGSDIVKWGDAVSEKKEQAKLLDIRGKVQNLKIIEFRESGLADALYLLIRLKEEVNSLLIDLSEDFNKLIEDEAKFDNIMRSTCSSWKRDNLHDAIVSDKQSMIASMVTGLKVLKGKIIANLIQLQQASEGQISTKDLQKLLGSSMIKELADSTMAFQMQLENISSNISEKYNKNIIPEKQLEDKLDVMAKNLYQIQEKIEKSKTQKKENEAKLNPTG